MPQIGETYLVQRGEYLVMIANRFGMDWRTLATLNGIGYPYVIYAGQVLHLR
jgi:lipoprotein NlpD